MGKGFQLKEMPVASKAEPMALFAALLVAVGALKKQHLTMIAEEAFINDEAIPLSKNQVEVAAALIAQSEDAAELPLQRVVAVQMMDVVAVHTAASAILRKSTRQGKDETLPPIREQA